MGRRHRALAGLLLPALLVTASACTQEAERRTLDIPSTRSTSPAADESPSSAPAVQLPPPRGSRVEERGYGVHALALPDGSKDRMLAESLVEYARLRVAAYHSRSLDSVAMGRVARGAAVDGVRDWVPVLQERGHHTVGHLWLEIEDDDVRRTGKRATFGGICAPNSTVDVDDRGIAVEDARTSFLLSGTARRVARGTWLIETVRFEPVACRPAA